MQGEVQLLLPVEERDPTNVVQLFQVNVTRTAAAADESVSLVRETLSGQPDSNATLEISTAVQCVDGFLGPSCDCQDTNDDTGHFTCARNGDRVCLEGYQNPVSNCTECIPSEGCCKYWNVLECTTY